ncbi:MAG: hypothetical protein AAF197_12930 [Pseudomonadota bacterium]
METAFLTSFRNSIFKIDHQYLRHFESELSLSGTATQAASTIRFDHDVARETGRLYHDGPQVCDNLSKQIAYQAFSEKTTRQYDWLLSSGVRFIHQDSDPYEGKSQPSKAMTEDVLKSGLLRVHRGGKEHHYLHEKDANGLSVNDKFRAIHDVFAHAMEGNSFGPKGEEQAWQYHVRMFSPPAVIAMTTETRGQNNWVNFGPHMFDEAGWKGTKNHPNYVSPKDRPFAVQKAFTLPAKYCVTPS